MRMRIDFDENNLNTNDSLEEIINKVDDNKLRSFLYKALVNDNDLLNTFRVEFSNLFPKLSKEKYKQKIYRAIDNCSDRHGFIDYSRTSLYTRTMYDFTSEAQKLVEEKDYDTAFIIVTLILNSIPVTDIDDSDGSTGMVADDCIDVIKKILEVVDNKENKILKEILNYVIDEVKSAYLYNYSVDLKELLKYFIDNNLYINDIETTLENALNMSKDKSYFYSRKDYISYLIQIYKLNNEEDKIIKILEEYSFDRNICEMHVEELIKQNKIDMAIKLLNDKLDSESYESRLYVDKLLNILCSI